MQKRASALVSPANARPEGSPSALQMAMGSLSRPESAPTAPLSKMQSTDLRKPFALELEWKSTECDQTVIFEADPVT